MRWLCPKCQRAVSLAYEVCPFCGGSPDAEGPSQPAGQTVKKPAGAGWTDVERGLRFGAGFLLALSIALFVLAMLHALLVHSPWLDRILEWVERLYR